MAINPLAYTESVVRNFLRYQLTTYGFADERLNRQLRDLLSLDETRETPLRKGPYVSLSRAFKGGAAVAELVDEGVLHPHLKRLASFPALYGHQEEAIRAIVEGRSTLISTGTGSGKSECFLYPVISRCLQLADEKAAPGICAVLVYPMNALAEDQLGRLRGLLAGTGIPFGMYVGKTPRNEADVSGVQLEKGASAKDYEAVLEAERKSGSGRTVHPAEEVCSREVMRTGGRQPRILLTNVNQLELLLTREQDVELFDGARLELLVFDEAHTFVGAQGAETACLIRRLRSFCGRGEDETVCVATSATIVDQGNPDTARDFASRFFGVDRDAVVTVHETYEPDVWAGERSVPPPPADPGAALRSVLQAIDAKDRDSSVRAAWKELTGEELAPGDWEEALHAALSGNELLYRASLALAAARPLGELLEELRAAVGREVTEEELILWLTLGAAARKDDQPLVRPVSHAFVRGIPGAVVTFDESASALRLHLSAEAEAAGAGDDTLRLPLFTCTTCGQHYFEHSLADFHFTEASPGGGEAEGERRYWQRLDTARGGVRLLLLDQLISEADDEEESGSKLLATVHLCRHCGTAHGDAASPCLGCGGSDPLVALQAVRQKAKQPGLLTSCVCCRAGGKETGGPYREPARPVRAVNVADVHVLAQEMVEHAERKRLLLFADNRQDAAFQAGWMRDHARRYRLRAMMYDALEAGERSVGDLVAALDRALDADNDLSRALIPEVWAVAAKESAGREHQDERKHFLRILVLREITTALKQQIGLEPWGRIKVGYQGLAESAPFVQQWSARLGHPAHEFCEGIAAFLDMIRRKQLLLDRTARTFSRFWQEGDREVMHGYLPLLRGVPKGLKLQRAPGDDSGRVDHWVSPTGHLTLAAEVARKWGVAADATADFLGELWQFLTSEPIGLLAPVTLTGSKGNALPKTSGTHQIDGDKLRLGRSHGAYRCGTCRRRTARTSPGRKCLAWHCKGTLEFVAEDEDDYDLWVLDSNYELLRPREHTAMVPQDERERIEELFKSDNDAINTLVCTQTLELGVDIGALDAVLMRNVPPLPANYWQRAGRAGRRHRMAVDITYSRQVSHDRAYFAEPLKMLDGRVDPPSFNLSNELMIGKHVRAAVLTRLQQLARPGSGLPDADRTEIRGALRGAFPTRIREYLFDDDGQVRSQPRDVRSLHTVITKHREPIERTVAAAFQQGWPAVDVDAVAPEKLTAWVLGMTDELEAAINRLHRRLHWALTQMRQLEDVRRREGVLEAEQESFYHRCKRLVAKYKGQRKKRRSEAEGLDDVVTMSVLAREGFLPGYGLESGSILGMAETPRSVRGGRDFELPRPPAVALREYVPGNLIYANGQKFVARRFAFEADHRQRQIQLEVFLDREAVRPASGPSSDLSAQTVTSVPICDVTLVHRDRISDEETNRFQMPVAIYGRELGAHGGGTGFEWGGRPVHFRRAVRLQLVNVGARSAIQAKSELGYPVCRSCGQSISPFSSERQHEAFRDHHAQYCGRPPEPIAFHTELAVDALSLPACESREEAYSVAEALRFAAASILDMDLEDLQVLVLGRPDGDELDALLYDPMPGGSGLLQQICERFDEVVVEAERIARDCLAACADSCIDCFRTYRNAFYHEHLNRHLVLERIETWGSRLGEGYPIPAQEDKKPDTGGGKPSGPAERKLKAMIEAAGLPGGQWQQQYSLPKPLGSTTPDVTWEDPDDQELRIFLYLDGLSDGIHGNPETRDKDVAIRAELRAQGHDVLEMDAVGLDDPRKMLVLFRKLGRRLVGRDHVTKVETEAELWFAAGVSAEEEEVVSADAGGAKVLPFRRYDAPPAEAGGRLVPMFDLAVAAGSFSEGQAPEPIGWAEIDMPRKSTDDLFVARVVGRSMEPRIPDGSWCLFTTHVGGSRDGRVLVVQHRDIDDPDHGGTYTLKVYHRAPETRHQREDRVEPIELQPLNRDYSPIELRLADEGDVDVIGEFLEVLRWAEE